MNSVKLENPNENENLLGASPHNVRDNIAAILLYSLSLVTALGFNSLVLNIFKHFEYTTGIIAKTFYVIIMFSITIGLAYYLNSNIKK